MSESENLPTDTEREQIEDDIERLKLALQEEDEIVDSDDEDVLHIDEGPKPGPSSTSGSTIHQDHKNKNEAVGTQTESTDHVQVSEDDQDIPISPETCLALNRVYQDILLDSLRRIEIALSENRSKQVSLEHGLEELTRRTSKVDASNPQNIKKPLTAFIKPYFKDINGRFAPDNDDYKMKAILQECKQDVAAPVTWYQKQQDLLHTAVVREALQQSIRPFMNKKEIECEKYMKADKDNNDEQKQVIKERIESIDKEIDRIKNMSTDDLLTEMDYDNIDWLKISSSDFHGKRDVEDCKKMWMNVLRPGINKEPWIEEESNLLVELVARHNMKEWNLVAEELGTGRTAFQCLQYYQQNLNEAYNKREWTADEDELLQEVVENCKTGERITWNQVAYFIEGRSSMQCIARWHQIDPAIRHGRWTQEEDCLLLSAVHLYGTSDWLKIAAAVPCRNITQCRDRYLNSLDPRLKPPSKWTYDEDKRLMQLVMKHNINGSIKWVKIAEELEGRTDHMVMTRYKRLMNWQAKCDWVESQDEETKKMLGTVTMKKPFNFLPKKSVGRKKMERERDQQIDRALNLAQFSSGVQRRDYQRQAEDKETGEIVVPRPPLSYNYSNRSSDKVWKHKLQLKKMVEDHLSNKLMQEMSAEEKLDLPAKTAAEFKPYFNASKSAKNIMEKILETKHPSSVSVADILAMTKTCEKQGKKVVSRMKRLNKDAKVEKQISEIIMTKTYFSLPTLKRAGRPKKINLFFPFGRKPQHYESTENVAQLTSVSTNLMLTALEVNGRKALNNAEAKDQSKLTASEKEDKALLKKLFPPLPSSVPKTQHIVAKGVSPQVLVSPSTKRPGEEKSNVSSQVLVSPSTKRPGEQKSNVSSQVLMSPSTEGPGEQKKLVSSQVLVSPLTKRPGEQKSNVSSQVLVSPLTKGPGEQKKLVSSQVLVSPLTKRPGEQKSNVSSQVLVSPSTKGPGEQKKLVSSQVLVSPLTKRPGEQKSNVSSQVLVSPSTKRPGKQKSNVSSQAQVSPSTKQTGEQKIKEVKVDTVKTVTDETLPSTVAKKAGKTSKIQKEQKEVEVSQTRSHGKVPVKGPSLPKGDDSVSPVSKTTENALANIKLKAGLRVIRLPAGTVIPQGKKGTILQIPSGKITLKPGQKIVKVSSPQIQTLAANPHQTKTKAPAAGPAPMVIKSGKPFPENIPMLPPGVKNMRGFANLLLQRKLLMARANDKYNVKFYQRQLFEINEAAKSFIKKEKDVEEKGEEEVDLDHTFQAYKEAGNQIMKGAARIANKVYKSDENTDTACSDPLSSIRQTAEYQLLKKRFQGLFVWPSLLATIQPPENPKSENNEDLADKETESEKEIEDDSDYAVINSIRCKKGTLIKESTSTSDILEKAMEKTSQSFAKRMKRRIDKKKAKKYRRKQYPCVKGKQYYRHLLKNKEWKKSITTKRLMSIKLRKEGVIEPKTPKPRRHSKRFRDLEKRSSLRLANKQLSVNLMKAESLKDPKASKTTPGKKCTIDNRGHKRKMYASIYKRFKSSDDTESNGNHGDEVNDNEDGPSTPKRSRMVQNGNDTSDMIKMETTENEFLAENVSVTTSAYQPQTVNPGLNELVTNQLACMASESSTNLLQNLSNQLSMLQEGGLIPVIMGSQPTQQLAPTGNLPVTTAAQGQTTPSKSVGQAESLTSVSQAIGQDLGIPGLAGHVLLAVPVSQLAGGLTNPQAGSGGQPWQQSIYPVNLVMNSNTTETVSQGQPSRLPNPVADVPSTNSQPLLLSTSSPQVVSRNDASATSVTHQTDLREVTPTEVTESRDTTLSDNANDGSVILIKTEGEEDTVSTSTSEYSQVNLQSSFISTS